MNARPGSGAQSREQGKAGVNLLRFLAKGYILQESEEDYAGWDVQLEEKMPPPSLITSTLDEESQGTPDSWGQALQECSGLEDGASGRRDRRREPPRALDLRVARFSSMVPARTFRDRVASEYSFMDPSLGEKETGPRVGHPVP